VGLARSNYYYPVPEDDQALSQAIEAISGEYPTYGSCRITAQLRREPYGR